MYFLIAAAFEMRFSFHVWCRWIRRSLFVCSETILIKLVRVENKTKIFFFFVTDTGNKA